MYVKQLKIVNGKTVKVALFSNTETPMQDGIIPLICLKGEALKNVVTATPTKLPPYNKYDSVTNDVSVKQTSAKDTFKRIMGISDKLYIRNMEQYVGVVKQQFISKGLPVFSAIYIFRNNVTSEYMIAGKLVSSIEGRRFMYSMLNRLGGLQASVSNGKVSNQYVGVVKNRAVTAKAEFEMLCDFIVSYNALEILERENFGFFVDTTAFDSFDYKIAGLQGVELSVDEEQKFLTWAAKHNMKMGKIIQQYLPNK